MAAPPEQIEFVHDLPAGHAFVTEDHGPNCERTASPYIVDCNYDLAGALLRHIGVGTPGGLDPLDVPAAVARAPDPPGLLGLADRRLAHSERTGGRGHR